MATTSKKDRPVTWTFTMTSGRAEASGTVRATDAHDAIARALATDKAMLLAHDHGVCADVLDRVPRNRKAAELQCGGIAIHVEPQA